MIDYPKHQMAQLEQDKPRVNDLKSPSVLASLKRLTTPLWTCCAGHTNTTLPLALSKIPKRKNFAIIPTTIAIPSRAGGLF